ncbi:GNAT family N-acetyltransferase [Paenibacillus sp. FSL R7-0345]|uniref:GNAT family N-acetyltransferase n=1 Tax=Paenibacillus sp. FSL R7-0345 TaxID=2954535 RepID=UPI00315A4257
MPAVSLHVGGCLTWIDRHEADFGAGLLYEFAVTDKVSGVLYGAIALSRNEKFNNGELAYWIGEEFWGNGTLLRRQRRC